MIRRFYFLLLLLFASACQSLVGDNPNLQLEADLQAYGTEAILLRDAMQAQRTEVMVTVERASTQIAQHTNYNRIIQVTAEYIHPSAATRVPAADAMALMSSSGPMSIEMFDLSDGQTRFVQVGTAGQITPENRCFVAHQSFFNSQTTSVIYMTALGLNVRLGTTVRVEWRYGGTLVHQENWSAPQSVDGQCIALELRPSHAPFLTGNWTATLYVNGQPIDPAPFTIVEG